MISFVLGVLEYLIKDFKFEGNPIIHPSVLLVEVLPVFFLMAVNFIYKFVFTFLNALEQPIIYVGNEACPQLLLEIVFLKLVYTSSFAAAHVELLLKQLVYVLIEVVFHFA